MEVRPRRPNGRLMSVGIALALIWTLLGYRLTIVQGANAGEFAEQGLLQRLGGGTPPAPPPPPPPPPPSPPARPRRCLPAHRAETGLPGRGTRRPRRRVRPLRRQHRTRGSRTVLRRRARRPPRFPSRRA